MGRLSKSKIYKYFDYDKKIDQSNCKHCSCKMKGNHGTNLKKHLKIHNKLYEEYIIEELSKCNAKNAPVPMKMDLYQILKPEIKVKTDMKTIISACVELVTVNGRPYSLLDDSGFRKVLDPILSEIQNSVVVNSGSIKKYIHEESVKLQTNIIDEIKFKLISIKIDAVIRLNRGFLGINLQYIANSSIKLRTIGLIELTESHTGVYLKDYTILNVLKKFNIEPYQLYTVTSDNGANMLNAINLLEEETSLISDEIMKNYETEKIDEINDDIFENENLENRNSSENFPDNSDDETSSTIVNFESKLLDENQISELLNEDNNNIDKQYEQSERILNDVGLQEIGDNTIFTGVRCVAHTLQLAVLDSLKDVAINNVLNKVRVLVRKLRNQTFQYIIKKEKLKLPILDCLTRWNSTLDMLERLQYLKNFIKIMSENNKKLKKVSLNNFEWQQVETISKALLPAKLCSKKLQLEQLIITDFFGSEF